MTKFSLYIFQLNINSVYCNWITDAVFDHELHNKASCVCEVQQKSLLSWVFKHTCIFILNHVYTQFKKTQ